MRQRLVAGLIIVFCLMVLVLAVKWSPESPGLSPKVKAQGAIGVVRIEGVLSGAAGGYSGDVRTQDVTAALREAAKRDDIKAVLIRIDSPGGSAAAAQEIAEEIERIKEKGKPVVASMGDVAASGGYWIAVSCDEVFANPATTTGSIGVITELVSLEELLKKMGIETEVIKSGPYKDMGSITRRLSPEERKLLEDLIDDVYRQFLLQVEKGRKGKMSPEQIRSVADGRIVTGNKARQLGLVDHLGNYYDALERAQELAGLSGEPQVIELNPQDPFTRLLSRLLATEVTLQPSLTVR